MSRIVRFLVSIINDTRGAVTPLLAGTLLLLLTLGFATYDAAQYVTIKRAVEAAAQLSADSVAHMDFSTGVDTFESRARAIFDARVPRNFTVTSFVPTSNASVVAVEVRGSASLIVAGNLQVRAVGQSGFKPGSGASTIFIPIVFNTGTGTLGTGTTPAATNSEVAKLLTSLIGEIRAQLGDANIKIAFVPVNETVNLPTGTTVYPLNLPTSTTSFVNGPNCYANRRGPVASTDYEYVLHSQATAPFYLMPTYAKTKSNCPVANAPPVLPFSSPTSSALTSYMNAFITPGQLPMGGCTNLTLGVAWAYNLFSASNAQNGLMIVVSDRPQDIHRVVGKSGALTWETGSGALAGTGACAQGGSTAILASNPSYDGAGDVGKVFSYARGFETIRQNTEYTRNLPVLAVDMSKTAVIFPPGQADGVIALKGSTDYSGIAKQIVTQIKTVMNPVSIPVTQAPTIGKSPVKMACTNKCGHGYAPIHNNGDHEDKDD
jgi:hypothetical protein